MRILGPKAGFLAAGAIVLMAGMLVPASASAIGSGTHGRLDAANS